MTPLPPSPSLDRIMTIDAIAFLKELHENFNTKRLKLLKDRLHAQHDYDNFIRPAAPKEMAEIRQDPTWKINPPPKDLEKRWIEITGPTDIKMVINALNSGADTFMADFEDSNCPTWGNLIEGQNNLFEAVRKNLSFKSDEGKEYVLKDKLAVLMVRPRGWHLPEKHMVFNNEPMSGSLFDFGLYLFHNAKELLKRNSGPYFYLPKMESYREAALWNEVFSFSEKKLGLPQNSIRATVLIETFPAAFQMEDILYVLKERILGLNAGRWDYIFSIIKKLRNYNQAIFPDRGLITMNVPFLKDYAQLLVAICHKRKAHAMGGMSAFVPSRKDPEVNKKAFAKVYEDKEREVNQGFDGTWVAHPDLIPIAREPFEKKLKKQPNQIGWPLPDFTIVNENLYNFKIPDYKITEAGARQNVEVALRYIAGWYAGVGAQAIHNLMEDAATAEISRAQLWQWLIRKVKLDEKTPFSLALFQKFLDEEAHRIESDDKFAYQKQLPQAKKLLARLVLEPVIPDFLTLPAYESIK